MGELLKWIQLGGPVLILLLILSLVAFALFIERYSAYRKISTGWNAFLVEFASCLDVYQTEAAEVCIKSHPGPLSRIANKALSASDREREELKEVVEQAGLSEIPHLEKGLSTLATIAQISPHLGLLGTVLGMIEIFREFQIQASAHAMPGPGFLASGIWPALITTAAGLSLGIITQVVHNHLFQRKEEIVSQLEQSSFEILDLVLRKRQQS